MSAQYSIKTTRLRTTFVRLQRRKYSTCFSKASQLATKNQRLQSRNIVFLACLTVAFIAAFDTWSTSKDVVFAWVNKIETKQIKCGLKSIQDCAIYGFSIPKTAGDAMKSVHRNICVSINNQQEKGAIFFKINKFSISTMNIINWFPDMPCMKRVHRVKKAPVHCSAARNKERFSSGHKPLVNHSSTADFVPAFPGHAVHEKGLQRQGVGPLVGSQERRALLVPVINRFQAADKPPLVKR